MSDVYIRAQDAIDAVHEEFDSCTVWDESGKRTADEVESIIDRVSSVDVVPVVHGCWMPYRCDMYECSVCQHIHTSFDSEECDAYYCPSCGAKMDAKEE